MFEPALVALTSTPSIAASLVELTRPVRAATCAWAETMPEEAMAKAAPTRATSEWCMVSPTSIFIGSGQHSIGCVHRASPPSVFEKTPGASYPPMPDGRDRRDSRAGASARRNYVWQGPSELLAWSIDTRGS